MLIPGQLKKDKKNSTIIKSPGITAGVLSLKGRVQMESLTAFFKSNMAKDNWRAITSLESERNMMLFQKDNRWGVIQIAPNSFGTSVEIWVAPTSNNPDGGLLK